jgi:hypothetical protein
MSYYKSFALDGASPLCQAPTTDIVDLLAGVPHLGVECDAPISEQYQTDHFNSPDHLFNLTDGTTCQVYDYHDPACTHFTGGTGRTVYFKLPYLSAATGFCAKFLYQPKAGVRIPSRVDVYLSEDGEKWKLVSRQTCTHLGMENAIHTEEAEFDCAYRTSYVKFAFDLGAHIWIESFSLYGCTETASALEIIPDGKEMDPRIVNS